MNPFRTVSSWGYGLIGLGVVGLLVAWSQPEKASVWPPPVTLDRSTTARIPCRVGVIFDGDTLGCDLNGDGRVENPREHVRLIGIDAPERHYSKKNKQHRDQPFSREAMDFLARSTLHRMVWLEGDEVPRDRYRRMLAYVYLSPHGGVSLNQALLAEGYATLFFIPPNVKYRSVFRRALQEAQGAQRGQWATEKSLPTDRKP